MSSIEKEKLGFSDLIDMRSKLIVEVNDGEPDALTNE
jgi:hypothetical protein